MAMDLRAFGVGPRTWLDELHFRRRDYFLVGFAVLILAGSLGLSILGLGLFWVPEFLIRLVS